MACRARRPAHHPDFGNAITLTKGRTLHHSLGSTVMRRDDEPKNRYAKPHTRTPAWIAHRL